MRDADRRLDECRESVVEKLSTALILGGSGGDGQKRAEAVMSALEEYLGERFAAMQLPEMVEETVAHEIAAPKFDAWWEKG